MGCYWHYKRIQQDRLAAYHRPNLPEECDITLTLDKLDLLRNTDATTLRRNIIDGKISCLEAVCYFSKRTFKYGRELNVVAQEHYKRAIDLAKNRDLELAIAKRNGTVEQLGAFFGVPISIKDMLCEEGESLTCGSTWLAAHYVAEKDAPIVALLKQ